MELPENCCLSCGAKLEYVQRIHLSYSVPLATLLILIISCSTDVAIWYCTFCVCVWKERNGERSSRERKQSNWIFWSPTRNSWSVTINAKCCTWHTLGGHVILPTPQLLLPAPLDGSRETTTSQPSWGGAQYKKKKMPSCVERLLLTAAALTLYVNFRRGLIRVHRSKDVRQTCGVFPHLWQAGKNKHQLQAGSLLLLLLSLCPKCHFLVSNTLSCQVVVCQPTMPPPKSNLSSKAEEGVAVAIETTSSSTTSSLQSLLWMPYKPSPPHLTHTHPPSHTPSPTMCFFFLFSFLFFSFLTASFTFGGFCNFRA